MGSSSTQPRCWVNGCQRKRRSAVARSMNGHRSPAAGCRIAAMGRKLAIAALAVLLVVPASAQAQSSLLPWPNDANTTRDKTTDTGRRLDLPRDAMPRNKDGVPIDPTDMNRADGFSPGSMIVIKVPGLDNQ